MTLKKIIILPIIFFSLISTLNVGAIEIKILPNTLENTKNTEITRKDFFIFLSNYFNKDIPISYKYINLYFKDIGNDEELKKALQVLVYVNLLENKNIKLFPNKQLNSYLFYTYIEKILDIYAIPSGETKQKLKLRNTTKNDLSNLETAIDNMKLDIKVGQDLDKLSEKKKIFSDVYETLITSHYDKDNLSGEKLIDNAIDGLTKGTNDKFTTYFPATESKNFEEDLNGKYEGIGAYVDMEVPGEFKIISPISGTPSEKSGLKGGDVILSVDGKKVTKENTLKEVVSWVKGPSGTKVKLEVKRGDLVFFVEIERAKIELKEVEYKLFNSTTYYIQIKTFGDTVSSEFDDAMTDLSTKNNVKNVIIDLRNNPGGYLDQVVLMLRYFVPKDSPVAVVKYKDYKTAYKSKGNNLIDFSKYKLIILQNSGTASASEIMIGTIKDYISKTNLVGENTYGKGSVQTIKSYSDGSSLKYTIAKWFTGKTETGINGVGIKPDFEVKLDVEKINDGYDNQFQKAIDLTNN